MTKTSYKRKGFRVQEGIERFLHHHGREQAAGMVLEQQLKESSLLDPKAAERAN